MSLVTDFLSLLTHFRGRIAEQVNSGALVTIDRHIGQLAAVAEKDVTEADSVVHTVLGELYTALHGHDSTPAPAPAPAVPAPAAPPAAPSTPAAAPAPTAPAAAAPSTSTAPAPKAG